MRNAVVQFDQDHIVVFAWFSDIQRILFSNIAPKFGCLAEEIVAASGWAEPEEVFNAIKDSFEERGFVLTEKERSIHDDSLLDFMTQIVQADEYALKVMREGLGTEFVIPPPSNFELQNKQIGNRKYGICEREGSRVGAGRFRYETVV